MNICTIKVFMKHSTIEAKQAKTSTGNLSPWYVDNWPEGEMMMQDPIAIINGSSGVKCKMLVETGITTAKNMKSKTNVKLRTIQEATAGISLTTLNEWCDYEAHQGIYPYVLICYSYKLI